MRIIGKIFPKFAVIGAGNGGLAFAGYLASQGYVVNLYNRTVENIKAIIETREIVLRGAINATGTLHVVTNDIKEAIENVDVIMIVVPASAHRIIAKKMAPYLRDGQIIVLNPGRTGGALEFRNTIREMGINTRVTVAEVQTLLYACRKIDERTINIFSVKNEVSLAALPATRTRKVINILAHAFKQFVPAKNVLETSFNNIGAIFHPAPTLLNSGRIEMNENFQYYIEGISPTIARILEEMDRERIEVGRRLGIDVITTLKWLEQSYGTKANNLYEAIQETRAYRGIMAPSRIDNRYIFEDVPASLVPISSIGKMLGVPTPTIDAIINLACAAQDINYWEIGRTVKSLGIEGKTPKDIRRMVMEEEMSVLEYVEGEVV
ncbi:NAD/NADP-dependent octopine/nopaline dehydrogenase family protein [Caminicella sporogenes]|uniref:NAD/NADP-dependent octopine/nopaline dehydrogenase family protein n=1 Tax=Caminicella sporogenes TaxID=166485 RepID=UPI002541BF57|nr:NAD/NADP-dependent octopine/nopaline dehydrogenase family protein [Caminicella sporogenes]WIF95699.1 NAD/NADP octopine/nopaline dehydrogenase family protein [Caminicella sporogenes]